jgi:hypothetical protein
LIDNGQIDESASEQCMSTDTYLDFMTDIETPSSPSEYYIKSWGSRDLLAPLLLWLSEETSILITNQALRSRQDVLSASTHGFCR